MVRAIGRMDVMFPGSSDRQAHPLRTPLAASPTPDRDADTDVQQDVRADEMLWVEPPYRVLIHNDDVTTFEFVIHMLQSIFRLSAAEAEEVAVITHIVGIALVCVRPQGEAEQLVNKAIFAARMEGFPLMLTGEPDI